MAPRPHRSGLCNRRLVVALILSLQESACVFRSEARPVEAQRLDTRVSGVGRGPGGRGDRLAVPHVRAGERVLGSQPLLEEAPYRLVECAVAGLAGRGLRDRGFVPREVDHSCGPVALVLPQELDRLLKWRRSIGVGVPGEGEPAVAAEGGDPGVLVGHVVSRGRLGLVVHHEALLVEVGQRLYELLDGRHTVALDEPLDERIAALDGGHRAVRSHAREPRELVEQARGQRQGGVPAQRELLQHEELVEHPRRHRGEAVAVQSQVPQQQQPVEHPGRQRRERVVRQVQDVEADQAREVTAVEAGEALVAQVQVRDLAQVMHRDLRAARRPAGGHDGRAHLAGTAADPGGDRRRLADVSLRQRHQDPDRGHRENPEQAPEEPSGSGQHTHSLQSTPLGTY